MAFEHKVKAEWLSDTRSLDATVTIKGGAQLSIDETLAPSAVNARIGCSIQHDNIRVLFIVCDRDVVVKTKDPVNPKDTLELKAGVPYVWHNQDYQPNIFTHDLGDLFITNNSDQPAKFRLECLYDSVE